MRIGIVDSSDATWTAGGEVAKVQAWSLLLATVDQPDMEVCFLGDTGRAPPLPPTLKEASLHALALPRIPKLSNAQRLLRRVLRRTGRWSDPRQRFWESWLRRHGIDVIICLHPHPWWTPRDVGVCSWIPDFQHLRLPGQFSPVEIAVRNRVYACIARQTDVMILSSDSVKQDFVKFSPAHAHKAGIFPFPSRFAFQMRLKTTAPRDELARYGIAEGCAVVANQFFAHKNYEQVIEAMGKLRGSGTCPQVVCIGQPVDYRDPSGRYLSRLLTRAAELRLDGKLKILGFVDGGLRDVLLRFCRVVLQPSRCEGWNTTIEDAKALGRPVIASRIDTHLEQVPEAYGFFDPDNPDELAGLLSRAQRELPIGPIPDNEHAALEAAGARAVEAGVALLSMARRAASDAARRSRRAFVVHASGQDGHRKLHT